jgi:hypothetical protein
MHVRLERHRPGGLPPRSARLLAHRRAAGAGEWAPASEASGDLFAEAPGEGATREPRRRIPPPRGIGAGLVRALCETWCCTATRSASRCCIGCCGGWRTSPRCGTTRSTPTCCRRSSMAQAVRRDIHKMRAFVRFTRVAGCRAWASAARGLVRARPPHRGSGGAVVRAPLRQHALGHPHARALRGVERPGAAFRDGADRREKPAGRRGRAALAHLLPAASSTPRG